MASSTSAFSALTEHLAAKSSHSTSVLQVAIRGSSRWQSGQLAPKPRNQPSPLRRLRRTGGAFRALRPPSGHHRSGSGGSGNAPRRIARCSSNGASCKDPSFRARGAHEGRDTEIEAWGTVSHAVGSEADSMELFGGKREQVFRQVFREMGGRRNGWSYRHERLLEGSF